ncbi:MAG: hypothetical protein CL927_11995 [Deltaproteobacteria bacterium]|nr:hypothetical protein [Deltaproteobacteria bacterium]
MIHSQGLDALVDALAPNANNACVVAHGQAVPIALHLAQKVPVHALVLSNGPIQALDPFATAVSRIARFAGPALRTWSRPALANTSLASSACLRRLVVNPYVMDRETVTQMTASWTADRLRRRAMVRWMRELPDLIAAAPPPSVPTLLVWGDEDVLYPSFLADQATGLGSDIIQVRVPGGRHLHIVERPWELADQVHDYLRRQS